MTTPIHYQLGFVETPFSREETRALEAVRVRFQQDHDVWSAREFQHLSFLRWLVQSGRLLP